MVCPGETRRCAPAFFPPGELDRVIAVEPQTTLDIERTRVLASVADHGETVAYTYASAVVEDGSLYAGSARSTLRPRERRLARHVCDTVVERALFCSTYATNRYFGHFLVDGLVTESSGDPLGLQPVVLDRTPWIHEHDYRQRLGLVPQRLSTAVLKTPTILDDRALNRWWISRFARLRQIAAGDGGGTDRLGMGRLGMDRLGMDRLGTDRSRDIVFLARGHSGQPRSLANEEQIVTMLAGRSASIVYPETSSVAQMRGVLQQASVVIAVEGSAIAHAMLLCSPNAVLLTIMPPRRFNAYFKNIADVVGMRWGFVVADDAQGGTFSLPWDRLAMAIDLALRAR